MIYLLLLLTIYIWPFGQLLTFSIPGIPFTIYLLDVIVFLVFVSLVLSNKRKEIFSSPITKPLLIFLTTATASLLVNIRPGLLSGLSLSALYLFRLIIYSSLFFAARFIGLKKLKIPLLISIGIFLILGLVQYLAFPDMRYLKLLGFDDHYFRLIGSLYDPNFTGAILTGIGLYLIAKNKIVQSLPFVGMIALTFSRASYLVFFIGLIYLMITNKKIKLLLLFLILGIAIILIPKPAGEGVNLLRTFSIFSRFDSWKQGINLFLAKPIIGWGYNTLRGAGDSRFQIDNSYIYLLATTGIIGISAFIVLCFKLIKSISDEGVKILILSILLNSIFNNTLFYIWISAMFWFVLGIGQDKIKEYKSA